MIEESGVHRLLRKPEVKHRIGLSGSQIDRLVKKGAFPPPVSLSIRAVAWREEEVRTWIEAREHRLKKAF